MQTATCLSREMCFFFIGKRKEQFKHHVLETLKDIFMSAVKNDIACQGCFEREKERWTLEGGWRIHEFDIDSI